MNTLCTCCNLEPTKKTHVLMAVSGLVVALTTIALAVFAAMQPQHFVAIGNPALWIIISIVFTLSCIASVFSICKLYKTTHTNISNADDRIKNLEQIDNTLADFGIAHWVNLFGGSWGVRRIAGKRIFDVPQEIGSLETVSQRVPPLPKNIHEILNSPCPFNQGVSVKDSHVLVLMLQGISEQQLVDKLIVDSDEVTGRSDVIIKSSYWMIMTKKIIPNCTGTKMPYEEQKKKVEAQGYRLPTMMEAALAFKAIENTKNSPEGSMTRTSRRWTHSREGIDPLPYCVSWVRNCGKIDAFISYPGRAFDLRDWELNRIGVCAARELNERS